MSETTTIRESGMLNDEEVAAIQRSTAAADALEKRLMMDQQSGRAQGAAMTPIAARQDGEPVAFITVSRAFMLNLNHQDRVEFPVGNYLCPVRLATSWWAVAHGVKLQSVAEIRENLPLSDLTPEELAQVKRMRADAARVAYEAMQQEAAKAEAALLPADDDHDNDHAKKKAKRKS